LISRWAGFSFLQSTWENALEKNTRGKMHLKKHTWKNALEKNTRGKMHLKKTCTLQAEIKMLSE